MKYTKEQQELLDYVKTNDGITLVSARAGTGKSFMAERITRELKPAKALYTAFNKAIVTEGTARFKGCNMECKTFHALAYKYVKPKKEIQDISYSCLPNYLPYKVKYEIITAINDFFVSNSIDMDEFFKEYATEIKEHSIQFIEQMIEGKVNPTFNFLLKYFHLLLVEEQITVSYDLVILDEINDTTAVSLEIFKLINAPKKLGLGETNQAIYDFLNLVDGFELLPGTKVFPLTRTFRCSKQIASNIQTFMQTHVSEDFIFIGTDTPVKNNKTLICTLTNAVIIKKIFDRLQENKGFHLLRKLSEIFAYPIALISASAGKTVYQKKYKFLNEEYDNYLKTKTKGETYFQYLIEHVGDQETISAVNLLITLSRNGINIFELYKNAKNAQVDLSYTIATVFTSKGLEFETVYITDDLNHRISNIINSGGITNRDDLVAFRCYYVACSRAGVNLNNAYMLP